MEQIGLSALFDLTAWDKGIDNYLRDVKRAENETQGMAGNLGRAYDSMGKSVLNAATAIGKTFVVAAAAATAAVGAFVVGGIKAASDLESQMGGIASIMGETKEAVGPLKDLIMDLGLDPTLKVNATEAADAIEKLASNGLTMTQIMEGAAKNTVLLANSTGADFETAAAIATDTMALFNIEAADMMTAVNGITGVTVASKFGINDYRLALSQAGGVASAVGVEFSDFNTSIAGISNYFASGSDAGTSFKTMLQRLVPTTTPAVDAMNELGLITTNAGASLEYLSEKGVKPASNDMWDLYNQVVQTYYAANDLEMGSAEAADKFNKWATETGILQSAFFDQEGQMRSMNDISIELNGAMKDLSDQEKIAALSAIFGTDAMRAAVGIAEQGEIAYTDQALAAKELGVSFESLNGVMEGGITKFEAMQIAIDKTSAVESAKVRMDNFKGSLEILQGVIDTVGLQIGFAFLPVLKELADRASELITQYAPMITEFFESFAAGVEKFVSGAPWDEVFPTWLANTISIITENINLLTGAIGGVAIVLAASSIGPSFAAIAGALASMNPYVVATIALAAALGAAWNTNFLGMKDATMAVIEPIANYIEIIQDAGVFSIEASEALTLFPESLQGIIGGIAETISSIGNYITIVQDAGLNSIEAGEAFGLLRDSFSGLITAVGEQLPVWQAQLLQWGEAAWTWIVEASGIAIAKIGEWATSLIGALAANLPTIIATMIEWSTVLVTWITDAIAGGITMLGTWAAALAGWISGEGKTQIGGGALQLVGALIDWVANDLIPKVAPAMGEFGAALAGGIVKIAASMGVDAVKIATSIVGAIMRTDYKSIGVNILTLIRDGWNATVSAVTAVVKTFVDGVKTKFTEVDWRAIGTSVLTYIKDGFSAVVGTAITVITTFVGNIKLKFTEIDWKAIGSSILTYVKDGITAMAPGALTALGTIVTSLKDKFSDTVNNWTATGKDILDKVRTGIESAKATTLTTITTVVADMRQRYVTPDGFAWSTIGSDISNAIRDGLQTAARAAGGILSAVVNVATFIKDQFTDQSWDEIGKIIINGIRDGLDAAAQAAGGLLTVVKNMGLDLMKSFTEINWEEVGRSMARLLKDGFKALAEGAGGLLPTVKGTGQSMVNAFSDIDWLALGRSILSGVLNGVKAIAYGAGGLIYVVSEIVEGFTEELFGVDWQEQGQKIIENIQAGLEAAKSKFMEVVKSIPAGIKQIFSEMTQEFKNIGAAIVDGIGSGITGAKDALMEKAQALANSLPGWVQEILGISSPSKVFMVIGSQIIEGLVVGIESGASSVRSALDKITSSLSRADLLNIDFKASDTFADRIRKDYLGISEDRLRRLTTRKEELEKTVASLQLELQRPGIDATRQSDLDTWIRLATQELAVYANATAQTAQEVAQFKSVLNFGDLARTNVSFLEDQIELMKQARALGIDVSGINVSDNSMANLTRMANIEKRIAELKQSQLYTIASQLRVAKVNPLLEGLQKTVSEQDGFNSFLNTQLGLMKKAGDLGMDLLTVWNSFVTFDPNDLQKQMEFQKKIGELTRQDTLNQMTAMIAEQKRVKGLAAAMQQLQPLIDQTNVSSAFGQKYKAEVLDPMLRALEKSAGIDSERLRLINEYTAAAQRLVDINKKEDQLSFLRQQMDVIKMIKDQDLVGGNSLFDGIAFGVNASIDDLLTLTNRVLNAMITEVKDELGIHSPSAVFADIGGQMMAGLSQGIQKGFMQPLNALRQGTVAHGSMSSRTLNFAMGGVTINTPMDEVMFESRVLRILERSMN